MGGPRQSSGVLQKTITQKQRSSRRKPASPAEERRNARDRSLRRSLEEGQPPSLMMAMQVSINAVGHGGTPKRKLLVPAIEASLSMCRHARTRAEAAATMRRNTAGDLTGECRHAACAIAVQAMEMAAVVVGKGPARRGSVESRCAM